MSMATVNGLVSNIIQNAIFCFQQKKQTSKIGTTEVEKFKWSHLRQTYPINIAVALNILMQLANIGGVYNNYLSDNKQKCWW